MARISVYYSDRYEDVFQMEASSANQIHNGRAALTQHQVHSLLGSFYCCRPLNFAVRSLSRPSRTNPRYGVSCNLRQHLLSLSTLFMFVVVLPAPGHDVGIALDRLPASPFPPFTLVTDSRRIDNSILTSSIPVNPLLHSITIHSPLPSIHPNVTGLLHPSSIETAGIHIMGCGSLCPA